jgi:undecaprenyl-diphosphatase
MAIPALTGAGLYEVKDVKTSVVGFGQMSVGIVVAFVVAYASIEWLLRFVAHHPITTFVWYRLAVGLALFVVLGAGWLSAK